MTALVGPVRLFDVEPDRSAPYEVRDAQVRRVTTTGELAAAAVYATAATAAATSLTPEPIRLMTIRTKSSTGPSIGR